MAPLAAGVGSASPFAAGVYSLKYLERHRATYAGIAAGYDRRFALQPTGTAVGGLPVVGPRFHLRFEAGGLLFLLRILRLWVLLHGVSLLVLIFGHPRSFPPDLPQIGRARVAAVRQPAVC